MMRFLVFAALTAASPAFAQTPAAPTCVSAGVWSYSGTGKGGATANAADKSTVLEFTPDKKSKDAPTAFAMTVDAGPAGVYQLNADFDVKHLSDDGLFTLTGATSAIPGRDFDVKVAKGDDGSSSFSRPVTTTGQPFQVEFHSKGAVSMTVRNVKLCRLR
ncbi:hypothetical protein FHS31_000402 [Sphingomonas vulcanisoli]|uniref:Uncharacterized protein n=1 Tax=Sphingomonas vulcanisoli TaxID=1658060 RepID=A0ABX0TSP5_9SPHN|nr:hypothetical protein [Sphingomonas vulcanisoli]NIJ06820.1 hypothetical protein [Sphingomonas vulcanisoli]